LSLVRDQRRRLEIYDLQGEIRKINPLTFDGDHKKGEDAEVWLFGMRKYFKLHNYLSNLEANIAI
jgi:hypothetical protein